MSKTTTTRPARVDQRIELRRKEAVNRRTGELMWRTGNVIDRHGSAIIWASAFLVGPALALMMGPGSPGWIPYSPAIQVLGGFGLMALVIVGGHLYLYRRVKWHRRRVEQENPCLRCGHSLRGVPVGEDQRVTCPECGHAANVGADGGVHAPGERLDEAAPNRRSLVEQHHAIYLQTRALMRHTGNVFDRHPFIIGFGLWATCFLGFWALTRSNLLGWIPRGPITDAVLWGAMLAPLYGIGYYRMHRLNGCIRRVLEDNPCVHCGQALRGVPGGVDGPIVCPECGRAVEARY